MKTILALLALVAISCNAQTNTNANPALRIMLFENRITNCVISVIDSTNQAKFLVYLSNAPVTFYGDKVDISKDEAFADRGIKAADMLDNHMAKNYELYSGDDYTRNAKERDKWRAVKVDLEKKKAKAETPYHHKRVVLARYTGAMVGKLPVWEVVKK